MNRIKITWLLTLLLLALVCGQAFATGYDTARVGNYPASTGITGVGPDGNKHIYGTAEDGEAYPEVGFPIFLKDANGNSVPAYCVSGIGVIYVKPYSGSTVTISNSSFGLAPGSTISITNSSFGLSAGSANVGSFWIANNLSAVQQLTTQTETTFATPATGHYFIVDGATASSWSDTQEITIKVGSTIIFKGLFSKYNPAVYRGTYKGAANEPITVTMTNATAADVNISYREITP